MDPVGIVVFGFVFILSLRFSYEVWFTPEKFQKRLNNRRNSAKNFFGFSFWWSRGKANIYMVRFAYTFILIVSILGLFASIAGSNAH